MVIEETGLPHGVMEGKGAYNRHAAIPARGAALATPFLEQAVRKVALDPVDQPVVIADYGSSQGKNSLAPMQIAIRNLRERTGPSRPIFVFHVDQPSNDFNSLCGVLSSDPDRYAVNGAPVFPCLVGRSFYEQVLPRGSVHLGWSSFAAQWLHRVPSLVPDHFFPLFSTGAARAAFERQAAEDWKAFLSLRAYEMRPGARLVIVMPTLPDGGISGFAELMNHANAVLREMADEGAITGEERARMVLGVYARRKEELLAPFASDGEFEGLAVEACDLSELPDRDWADYQSDRDKEALATKHALFIRAVFMPSLASALSRAQDGDGEAQRSFADRLEDGLVRRLIIHPTGADMFVHTIVLAKAG
ncbi:MAG: hypothetical protein JOY62_06325 [Acidobacteriaceae bacterium]|nr:hypothetical protein [Acidobacteriaceae bacterium]MBV9779574.1 hypothetical protein [Acidobacteriaceae bacterium]